MNIPNKLSFIRIFLVPLLVVFILTRSRYSDIVALIIFIVAITTDWADGYIARNSKQITTLGKFLDPLADKLLISATFISLVEIKRVQAWIVVIIVGRELTITGMRAIAASQQLIIPASKLGKYKVAVETAAIIILILNLPYHLCAISAWAAMLMAVISGADHLIKFKKSVKLEC